MAYLLSKLLPLAVLPLGLSLILLSISRLACASFSSNNGLPNLVLESKDSGPMRDPHQGCFSQQQKSPLVNDQKAFDS